MIKSEDVIRVLVIEDEDSDFEKIKEILYKNQYDVFEIVRVETIEKALYKIEKNGIDLILSDLNLEDSTGLQTVFILNQKTDTPFIILSVLEDYSIIIKTIKSGASDFFIKWKFSANELNRAIKYAIDNFALNKELTRYREFDKFQKQTKEFKLEPQLTKSLRVRNIKSFAEARKHYSECLDKKVDKDPIYKDCIEDLACGLIRAFATSQDILRIHTLTLRDKLEKNKPERAKQYVEESKIILTELFANLLSKYRNKLISGNK